MPRPTKARPDRSGVGRLPSDGHGTPSVTTRGTRRRRARRGSARRRSRRDQGAEVRRQRAERRRRGDRGGVGPTRRSPHTRSEARRRGSRSTPGPAGARSDGGPFPSRHGTRGAGRRTPRVWLPTGPCLAASRRIAAPLIVALALLVPLVLSAPAPAAQSDQDLMNLACSLPHRYLVRTWNGFSPDRGPELTAIPAEPNFVGSGLPHVGPWDYVQHVPMFWYGPGHIKAQGQVERPVTLADIAPDAGQAARLHVHGARRHADDRGAHAGPRPDAAEARGRWCGTRAASTS